MLRVAVVSRLSPSLTHPNREKTEVRIGTSCFSVNVKGLLYSAPCRTKVCSHTSRTKFSMKACHATIKGHRTGSHGDTIKWECCTHCQSYHVKNAYHLKLEYPQRKYYIWQYYRAELSMDILKPLFTERTIWWCFRHSINCCSTFLSQGQVAAAPHQNSHVALGQTRSHLAISKFIGTKTVQHMFAPVNSTILCKHDDRLEVGCHCHK